MQFSQHALEKCALDLNRGGSRARVFEFLDRPWVAVLTPDDVEARRAGGRWLFRTVDLARSAA